MVPISAHALFARPDGGLAPLGPGRRGHRGQQPPARAPAGPDLMAEPAGGQSPGAVCGARPPYGRSASPGHGSRSGAARSPVLLARLHGVSAGADGDLATDDGGAPFTDRLVAKFGLPVTGWRGRGPVAGPTRKLGGERRRAGRPCLRKSGSPGSALSTTRCWSCPRGFTVVTGETGAGKTMVVTGLGLLFGGRADPARVRPGAAAGRGRRPADGSTPTARWPVRSTRRAASSTTTARPWSSAARCRPRAGPGRTPAAARCRCRCSPTWPTTWSPCTASPTSSSCCGPAGSARPWTGTPAPSSPSCWPTTSGLPAAPATPGPS